MPRPPRLAEALLRLVLSPEDAEVIAGDLEETLRTQIAPPGGPWRARSWYWWQALNIVSSRLARPGSHSPDSGFKRTTMAAIRQDLDRAGQPKIVVINETAARAFWKDEDPIGKRIAVGQGGFGDGAEVVGIVADVRYGAVETSVRPDVYIPLLQSTRTLGFIFVRSRVPADTLVKTLRHEVQALDPDLPLIDIKMMDQRYGDATWRTRMSAWLLGAFSTLALLLAALGIYSVMAQGVAQRTREIGVRLALGAARADIMRLIIGRAFAIALAGILLGVLSAIPSMRLLTALLYQVSPGDPLVFMTLALVLLSVAVLAGYVPARRATRVDPLTTLRAE